MTDKSLTDKQKAFVQNFSSTGNATQSAISAGYSAATAEQQGYTLKKQLAQQIEEETRRVIGSTVPMAVEKLRSLLSNDKTPANVQLGAINSILDRAGFQTTHKVEDVTNQRTDAELRLELVHLMSSLQLEPVTETDELDPLATVNPSGGGLVN
tara:strand:- start:103 stop:564 length:462 start_codon:yes stop_codon:yes gene_type:complete